MFKISLLYAKHPPLFSVLIANFNCGEFLDACINSVINQTYSNWEIVLVDDCSLDNSMNVIQAFKKQLKSKLRVFVNETNKGCTYTKSECIKYAKGVFCGFLDADDLLEKTALEKMAKTFCDDDVSIVSSRYYLVDEKLNIIGKNRLLDFKGQSYLENRDYSPEHFVAFKLVDYLKTKGLDKTHKFGDDQELYLLLEEVGKWVVLDDFLYYYRQHDTSVCKTSTYECYFWNIIDRYEACQRRGLDVRAYALQDYVESLDIYAKVARYEAEKQIRESRTYKIGSLILKPIRWLFYKNV